MFHTISLRGVGAAVLWGHREAAALHSWCITKQKGHWLLVATLTRGSQFQLQQRDLIFSAPRLGLKGFWCWPVEPDSIVIQSN